MNKLEGLIVVKGLLVLGFIAGWSASQFMSSSRGHAARKKLLAKAVQLKGRVKQALGEAGGLKKTQAHGEVAEATGRIREKVADVKGKVEEATRKAHGAASGTRVRLPAWIAPAFVSGRRADGNGGGKN